MRGGGTHTHDLRGISVERLRSLIEQGASKQDVEIEPPRLLIFNIESWK